MTFKKTIFMKSILTSLMFTLGLVAVSGQEVNILPISLKNFTLNLKNESTVEVKWDIIHQNKASGYFIEHSFDSKNWQPVGFVSQISNDSYKSFSFNHTNTATGFHYYRIRLVHIDGIIYYSEVKAINIKKNIQVMLWPNPSQDYLQIQFNDQKGLNTKAIISNEGGMKVIDVNLTPGCKVDIRKLNRGIYYVTFITPMGHAYIMKFVKS
jgi:hypothetical protein